MDDYDDQIDAISRAKHQFETLADEVDSATAILSSAAAPLAAQFTNIEESLQRLVREYQRERAHFSGLPATLGLNQLPQLSEFREHVGTAHHRDPVQGFPPVRNGFHKAQRLIWNELVRTRPTVRHQAGIGGARRLGHPCVVTRENAPCCSASDTRLAFGIWRAAD